MTLADATRAWFQNLLSEKEEETCMWELTVIRADRFDWAKRAPAARARCEPAPLWGLSEELWGTVSAPACGVGCGRVAVLTA
eukprot:1946205-Prymnesium_polylepis.1